MNHIKRYETMIGLMAELIIDHSLKQFKIQQIKQKIEESLINNNKEEFMELTKEYNKLMKGEKDVIYN